MSSFHPPKDNNTIMSSKFLLSLFLYAVLACLILLSLMKRRRNPNQAKDPPGPPGLPLIGNLHQLKTPLHKTLHHLSNTYGDLMFLQLGSVPALVISSADVAREIFNSHDLIFSGRPPSRVAKKMKYNGLGIVFATYGEYWREVRKIATLELLSVKRVQSFQAVRDQEVTQLLNSVASSSGPVNLSELIHILTNNVICGVAFGKKFHDGSKLGARTQELLRESQKLLATICLSDYFPRMGWLNKINGFDARLDKVFREVDKIYDGILEEHRDRPDRHGKAENEDFVDVLIRLQKDSHHQSVALTNDFIKAFIADIFVAGTDTSSSVLVWAMAELIRNPTVMRRAQEEVRRVVMDEQRVKEDHLPELVYIKLVVKETLRIHPAAPMLLPRETIEACQISGYKVPAKTRVFINAKAIGSDHRLWENPFEFRPERFMNNSIDFRSQHFEFIPFGFGRRICPGINFAIVIIELVLANLLYHFNWELPQDVTIENMNMDEALGITVHKKTPLLLVASSANG